MNLDHQNTHANKANLRTYYDYSKEYWLDEKSGDSDGEVDIIFSEEIKESSSKEYPLRHSIHETKSALQFSKIKSESYKSDYPEFREFKTIENVSSLDENYHKLIKYEPFSNKSSNKYIPIRQASPIKNQNKSIYEYSKERVDHDENNINNISSSVYAKSSVLRKRNRDPYNSFVNNKEDIL